MNISLGGELSLGLIDFIHIVENRASVLDISFGLADMFHAMEELVEEHVPSYAMVQGASWSCVIKRVQGWQRRVCLRNGVCLGNY